MAFRASYSAVRSVSERRVNSQYSHANDRRPKCTDAESAVSAIGSKMMSTKAAAFSIAALLGLPSSSSSALLPELETSAGCTSREVNVSDLDMNGDEIDVVGAEENQQPVSGILITGNRICNGRSLPSFEGRYRFCEILSAPMKYIGENQFSVYGF